MKTFQKLLPLLIVYLAVIAAFSKNEFIWDESGYVTYATNLVNGFSPGNRIFTISLNHRYIPGDHIIWWGPGYPLLLTPFVLFNLPWIGAKFLNGFLLFGGMLYLYHTLRMYLPEKQSLVFTYIVGLYPLFLRWMTMIYTETLVLFMICGIVYHFCRMCRERTGDYQFTQMSITGLYLGFLALTKVFFGYVILASLLISLLLLIRKHDAMFRRAAVACAIGYFICTPWFVYTYSLTGKLFYWGNSGGLSLYWMATPYKDELGDWIGPEHFASNAAVAERHGPLFERISKLPPVEQDDAYKREAIRNILAAPKKFVMNIVANAGRLVLHYPYSYSSQTASTYIQMIPNMFFVVAAAVAAWLSYFNRKGIPKEIFLLLGFNVIAFVGSSLLSAYPRQFIVMVPIFSVWIFVVLSKTVKLERVERATRST